MASELGESAELIARVAKLVRSAILTIKALPDRERRWLASPRSSMPTPLRTIAESYDNDAAQAETAKAARFQPSPADVGRCLDVLAWLTWLGVQGGGGKEDFGRRAVIIITGRAFGQPFWRLAHRFACSDDTVRRWETMALGMIAGQFRGEIDAMGEA